MDILTPDDPWTAGFIAGPAIELKLLGDAAESGTIEGYAATFGGMDHGGDTIAHGAFKDSLEAHRSAGTSPAMLWHHLHAEPIGKWTAMGEDARGLRVRGTLNRQTVAGQKAHAHIKNGDATGLSIGFVAAPGGASRTPKGRTLTKVHLHEASVVTVPMDSRARITEVKSLASRSELEDMLLEGGLPKGAARKIAAAGWPALSSEPEPSPSTENPALSLVLKALDRNLVELKGLVR